LTDRTGVPSTGLHVGQNPDSVVGYPPTQTDITGIPSTGSHISQETGTAAIGQTYTERTGALASGSHVGHVSNLGTGLAGTAGLGAVEHDQPKKHHDPTISGSATGLGTQNQSTHGSSANKGDFSQALAPVTSDKSLSHSSNPIASALNKITGRSTTGGSHIEESNPGSSQTGGHRAPGPNIGGLASTSGSTRADSEVHHIPGEYPKDL